MTHDTAAEPTDPQARLADAVAAGLEGRRLLTHPFYRRWEAGELRSQELAEYAVHYRAFEAVLPTVLAAVVDRLTADGDLGAADLVARNLADELGRPEPHLDLFDEFAAALPDAVAGSARTRRRGPGRHLPRPGRGVARRGDRRPRRLRDPGRGHRRHQGGRAAPLVRHGRGRHRFWDVHATMDADHGDWAVEALALLDADPTEVADASRRAADAWWALLDERDAEGLVAVA